MIDAVCVSHSIPIIPRRPKRQSGVDACGDDGKVLTTRSRRPQDGVDFVLNIRVGFFGIEASDTLIKQIKEF